MKSFKTLNLYTAWLVFAIAAVTYLMCIEPTASLWDCGEFISAAYKLEVGHSPGAPFFLLMGRFFTLFAPGVENVAIMVNIMSALASAFTILFLFWTITHLFCKMIRKRGDELNPTELILCLGTGIVGALSYTFSDTFWFSAVEGEVYATSSLFTAVVFWAILKWEDVANEPYANRWLILIAYLMGLSIGVHLLNLLAIPAIVMVYYFKKYKFSAWGCTKAAITAILILVAILYGIIPLLPLFASKVELLFVNNFGLPINSGLLFFIALAIALLIFAIYYTLKKGRVLANTIALCTAVICLGYGSYAMIVIRSSANPPMDQNNPDNMFSLMSYLNRDQYGTTPLLYGYYYNAPLDYSSPCEIKDTYAKVGDKYEKVEEKLEYKYMPQFKTIFPRMYSSSDEHVMVYKAWGGSGGHPVKGDRNSYMTDNEGYVVDRDGERLLKPTFGNNLSYFFSYQVNWMYWRYFLWNFSGRQNDLQGHGDPLRGNWITGIKFLDDARLGSQDKEDLPEYLANNKGHNKYYMLPLLLGLIGIVVHLMANKKDFTVVLLLFFFTGLAIVVYLNQTPYQPRERDYAYAGSFYAFAIWIGLGVVGVYALTKKLLPSRAAAISSTVVSLLAVPVLMTSENWDDHDRSGRYLLNDFGYNMLNSSLPNSVIFTYGDSDTFAGWYCQEVEGVRTDVRVSNVSYLYSDWYYEQMMRKTYESDALKTSATPESIAGSRRNVIGVDHRVDGVYTFKSALDFVMLENPKAKTMSPYYPRPVSYFPIDTVMLDFDINRLKKAGVVPDTVSEENIRKPYIINLDKSMYGKNQLAIFDIIVNNYNDRPIYFFNTPSSFSSEFAPYVQTSGLAKTITPYVSPTRVDTERSYDLFMNKFRFRGLNDSSIYVDESVLRQIVVYRTCFIQLVEALIKEERYEKAKNILDKCVEVMPLFMEPYSEYVVPIGRLYARMGEAAKAEDILSKTLAEVQKELKLYASFPQKEWYTLARDIWVSLKALDSIYSIATDYKYSIQQEAHNVYATYSPIFAPLFR
ncbi:MAG: DUF2723 domain-containing protein [Prevotellaceae bacterium]|jgi:hypothetical protein|nr:DUF2723 domain-containing protein [Prevotellaceae bacterium]